MKLEDDYKPNKGSGSGTETAYTVEARYNYPDPSMIGVQIFDNKWRTVNFDKSQIGIPQCSDYAKYTKEHGMYGYQAAQALRWWFVAAASMIHKDICLETRIVKHVIEHSYSITAVSAHDLIGNEDRSGMIPDWGKDE